MATSLRQSVLTDTPQTPISGAFFDRPLRRNPHPQVEVNLARSLQKRQDRLAVDPHALLYCAAAEPLEALAASRRRACRRARRAARRGVDGRREVAEERLRRELRHLDARRCRARSRPRRRAAPARASGARRRAARAWCRRRARSGRRAARGRRRRRRRRRRRSPRAPRTATKLASTSTSSRRSRERAGVEEVVAVEEVERRLGHQPARRCRRASNRNTAAATLTLSDSTAPVERDRHERVAGPADERPQPLPLGAEHERDAAGEVGAPEIRRPPRPPRRRPRAPVP